MREFTKEFLDTYACHIIDNLPRDEHGRYDPRISLTRDRRIGTLEGTVLERDRPLFRFKCVNEVLVGVELFDVSNGISETFRKPEGLVNKEDIDRFFGSLNELLLHPYYKTHCKSHWENETKLDYLIRATRGHNLCDEYWFRIKGDESLTWADINFQGND